MEADDAVAVGISFPHHVAQFSIGKRVAHLGHLSGELGGGDVAVAVAVEGAENLHELILVDEDLFVDVGQNGVNQFVEFDGAVAVGVDVGEKDVDLVTVRFEAEGAEEGGEFEVSEAAVVVHVEAAEDVLQLLELIRLDLSHHDGGERERERERDFL